MTRHDVELVKYLLDNQITLIPVSEENQINYGCNGLNLGNGRILSIPLSPPPACSLYHSVTTKIS